MNALFEKSNTEIPLLTKIMSEIPIEFSTKVIATKAISVDKNSMNNLALD